MGSGPISVDKTSLFCVSVTPKGASSTLRWNLSDALEFDFISTGGQDWTPLGNLTRSPGACPQAARIGRHWTSRIRSLGACPQAARIGHRWTSQTRFPGACPMAATVGRRWTSQISLSGCLSNGGRGWTTLDKSNSLSGRLFTGGQDWTPMDKSNSLAFQRSEASKHYK